MIGPTHAMIGLDFYLLATDVVTVEEKIDDIRQRQDTGVENFNGREWANGERRGEKPKK